MKILFWIFHFSNDLDIDLSMAFTADLIGHGTADAADWPIKSVSGSSRVNESRVGLTYRTLHTEPEKCR